VKRLDRGSFGLRYVGNRFQLVWIERVVVGDMWATGLD
jgi:hypothetical protein